MPQIIPVLLAIGDFITVAVGAGVLVEHGVCLGFFGELVVLHA